MSCMIRIRFTTPQQHGGERATQAEVEADRIRIDDGRLLLLLDGAVQADFPVTAVSEIDLRSAKTYSVEKIRTAHPQAYKAWTAEEERLLRQLHDSGTAIAEIAEKLGRQPGAIRSRLKRLLGR
ncbi:hypothetical protein Acsp04_67030 [Actinomadura sp. NBRC 104425]|nr:hypothetical protein Acsp04_67030 [Actinomadura sp. NBRC 104425]